MNMCGSGEKDGVGRDVIHQAAVPTATERFGRVPMASAPVHQAIADPRLKGLHLRDSEVVLPHL